MSDPKSPSMSIPKFASFSRGPKAGSTGQHETTRRRRRSESDDREQRRRRHDRSRSASRESKPPGNPKIEPLWVIDRKGDSQNLLYGSIHRYSVPPFRRTGAGVLGLPAAFRIDQEHSNDRGIVVSGSSRRRQSREKYIFSKVEKDRPRLLKIRPEFAGKHFVDDELDFVPLRGRRRKRRGEESLRPSESEDDGTHYRSIDSKPPLENRPNDETFQYATESESSASERALELDEHVKQETIRLAREVDLHPHDVDAWMALIQHQDTLIRADGRRRITNAETRSTADIKIHMYEKALEKASSLQDREKLLLGLMIEGSKIWEVKVQADRWKTISKQNISSLLLWRSYVDFKQSTFSDFRWEEIRDVFVNRMKMLLEAISTVSLDSHDPLYIQLLYVLLRFTIFSRESGYVELAVAIWQGLLEFNCFAPSIASSHQAKVKAFKDFWESEVPRIGEDDALGWRSFVNNAETAEPRNALIDEVQDSLNHRILFRSWAESERLRSKASRVPARTMDDVVEDDPFRVILVSDVEKFLVSFPMQTEAVRNFFLTAFLLFCRLPPLCTDSIVATAALNDPFIRGELLEADPASISHTYSLSDGLDRNAGYDISHILKTPSASFSPSSESMFNRTWFCSIPAWNEKYAGDNGPLTLTWVRNILKQLTQVLAQEDFAEYYLAFEWRNEPETIKKISKSLLRQNPSSLKLYNAYAVIERSRGNKELANSVFSAALSMSKATSEKENRDSIILWKSWIWASFEDSDHDTAQRRILSIPDCSFDDNIGATSTICLQTRQYLVSNRDVLLSSGDVRLAVVYAECLALLEYFSSKSTSEVQSSHQGDVAAALSTFSNFSNVLAERGLRSTASHELFLQSAARLLYHHARIGPFRPALLREHLTTFLEIFPQNTIFLSLYAFNESRLRIDNRVRTIFNSTVLSPQNDALSSRLFAIFYEINYGTIHSARSTFEKALSSPSSKSSAGLVCLILILKCHPFLLDFPSLGAVSGAQKWKDNGTRLLKQLQRLRPP
jgi:hypothetical protein